MERVQFQQEQMLAELKDLVDKKLFTESETKQIFKKRTGFEIALVRRVANKSDFLRYLAYEMGLEQLRRKRAERLKIARGPSTVSDYALVKRQFQILERAVKKFKSDVDLWIQYIQVAKRERARSLVGKITARALQLHPNEPKLYILAASHEIENLSPSAARTLLQRGLRLNKESIELWKEYVKMELGYIETVRRRWDVLGIPAEDGEEGAAAARKEIVQGGIVKSVMTNAVKATKTIRMVSELQKVIESYGMSGELREALLVDLYGLWKEHMDARDENTR
ncbi:U3 small nucleolar RNA-associated protein 6 domain containing protein [Amanita muscaria]|uniref:U3 small nucleolar RNA-associated protein 6 n=1 Tax=Amanita muscaria (strain Koide BX008) TaxID=946122 RepID=A0A0C2X3X8_AMAMK|nr:hypothetical protein M378DRAFT_158039 [Amanita muscaria Koide BX008]